jgi:NADPH2:quinone reductase
MKAVMCEAFGPIESLKIVDLPSKPVGPKDVRVAVHVASLGYMDTLMARGLYQLKPDLPYTPGACGAGYATEVGSEVTGVKVGDRVSFLNYFGAFAEEIVTQEDSIVVLPQTLDLATAATYRLSFSPAYIALQYRAKLQPGETLLVNGAAGGVGMAAVKLGVLMGARVIGSVGSDAKGEIVRAAGAEAIVNYSTESVRDRVKELTGGKGADVILDTVGGDVFDQSLRCVNLLGRIIVMGFTSGRIPSIPANLVLLKNCSIIGVFFGGWMTRDPEGVQRMNNELLDLAAAGKIRAHIHAEYPLERTVEAMQALLNRESVGKIVIRIREGE